MHLPFKLVFKYFMCCGLIFLSLVVIIEVTYDFV